MLLVDFRGDETLDVGDWRRHGTRGADGFVVCGRRSTILGVETALETADAEPEEGEEGEEEEKGSDADAYACCCAW
jgi:hypothetical protein